MNNAFFPFRLIQMIKNENHRGSFMFIIFSILGEQFEWKDRVEPNIVAPFATRQAANVGAVGTCVTDRAGDVGSDAVVVPTAQGFVTEVVWSGITAHGRCVTECVGYGITSTRLSLIMSSLQVCLLCEWKSGERVSVKAQNTLEFQINEGAFDLFLGNIFCNLIWNLSNQFLPSYELLVSGFEVFWIYTMTHNVFWFGTEKQHCLALSYLELDKW